MRENVHDNWVYAQAVDFDSQRIVLHTIYPHACPPEYIDIVFEGVVVHHFEQQLFSGTSEPSNVLFGVEECAPTNLLGQYTELLSRTKNYGWPVWGYDSLDDLALKLTASGAKCFDIHGTCGLSGFVFAASVKYRNRQMRSQAIDHS